MWLAGCCMGAAYGPHGGRMGACRCFRALMEGAGAPCITHDTRSHQPFNQSHIHKCACMHVLCATPRMRRTSPKVLRRWPHLALLKLLLAVLGLEALAVQAARHVDVAGRRVLVGQAQRLLELADAVGLVTPAGGELCFRADAAALLEQSGIVPPSSPRSCMQRGLGRPLWAYGNLLSRHGLRLGSQNQK